MICLWSFSHPKSSRLRNERTEPEFCHRTVWKLVFFTFSMKASLVGGTICKFVKDEWPFPFFFTPYKQSCMGHVCAVLYAIAACWNEASGLIMPNFVQIGQGVAEIWPFSIFQDGGRPPSWICYMPVWTTHEVYFGGLCHCAKFGLNRCSSFDNMQVLIFWALSLKMPIHAHFGGVLRVQIGEFNRIFLWFYTYRK